MLSKKLLKLANELTQGLNADPKLRKLIDKYKAVLKSFAQEQIKKNINEILTPDGFIRGRFRTLKKLESAGDLKEENFQDLFTAAVRNHVLNPIKDKIKGAGLEFSKLVQDIRKTEEVTGIFDPDSIEEEVKEDLFKFIANTIKKVISSRIERKIQSMHSYKENITNLISPQSIKNMIDEALLEDLIVILPDAIEEVRKEDLLDLEGLDLD